jgi:hypothetical protein
MRLQLAKYNAKLEQYWPVDCSAKLDQVSAQTMWLKPSLIKATS